MENIKRTLFDKLRDFHNDKDFVIGVMSNAKHDEDREVILEFIENEKEASIEDVILLSLHLANQRK